MKKRILLAVFIIGLKTNAQEIVTDWSELDGQTTLKEYIQEKAYYHLNFKSTDKDSINGNGASSSHSSLDTKVTVRYHTPIWETPLVIINRYPTDNKNIWSSIKLANLKNINLIKPTDKASAIYGTRGLKGVIIVEMNKRKWRKIKSKYAK